MARSLTYSLVNLALNTVGKNLIKTALSKRQYLPAVKDDVASLVKVNRPEIYFDRDIGGLEKVKEDLRISFIYPRTRRDLYLFYDKPIGNVLLYGPPGCGKTMLAKAVATECNWVFISPHMGDIIKRHVGDRERAVSSIFEYCRSMNENSVLFLDELEPFVLRNGPPYVQRIKDEFQMQMDGIDSKKGFPAVIGASNKPWLIDTAIRRPGRFSKLIFVPPPDFYDRKQILRISLSRLFYNNVIEDDIESLISDLAERTEGFSGDDITSLVDRATDIPFLEAVKSNRARKVRKKDFEEALKTKRSSISSWFSEAIRACKRYDEKNLLEEILSQTELLPKENYVSPTNYELWKVR